MANEDDQKEATVAPYDLYVTGGKRMGRILLCKKPFYRGDGVFCQSMDKADWRIVGDKTLTDEELEYYMEKIRETNIEALIETIRHYVGEGYDLDEEPPGTYTLIKDELE